MVDQSLSLRSLCGRKYSLKLRKHMPMRSGMVINLATVGVYMVSYILCMLYGKPPTMCVKDFGRVF